MEACQEIKQEIAQMWALKYFHTSKESVLQTNASRKWLHTVKMQGRWPICFASRAQTETEKNYQNIEREALGTIWGMEHFHYYLYAQCFTSKTEEKP